MNTHPDTIPALRAFLVPDFQGPAGLPLLKAALRAHCTAGNGDWYVPDEMGADDWRPSHLVEISAFEVAATGNTLDEATHNWRKLAMLRLDMAARHHSEGMSHAV